MTTDFPTAPSAYGLNGPSAAVTVEKSLHASHTEILTTPLAKMLWQFQPKLANRRTATAKFAQRFYTVWAETGLAFHGDPHVTHPRSDLFWR